MFCSSKLAFSLWSLLSFSSYWHQAVKSDLLSKCFGASGCNNSSTHLVHFIMWSQMTQSVVSWLSTCPTWLVLMCLMLFSCAGEAEAHRLHERLLRPCDDYCFFIMKTTTDSIPRWERERKKNNNNLDCGRYSTMMFFCGLCYYHNFYINHFCLLLFPNRVILRLSIKKICNRKITNNTQPWLEISGLSKHLWRTGMFKIEAYFSKL